MENKNIIQLVILCLVFLFHSCVFAQNKYLIENEVFLEKSFVYTGTDTISYLINSTKFDINKPSVIYFNGSFPVPLVIKWGNEKLGTVPFSYFKFDKFLDSFNLILISKPFTPVCVKFSELVNSYYVPDTTKPNELDSNFVASNDLNYLGKRGSFFIDCLVNNKEINSKRILIIGHSQGGIEVARVAKLNKKVTDVVMLAASAYGRPQQVLSNYYLKYLVGEIDFKTYLNYQNKISKAIEKEYLKSNENTNIKSFHNHSINDMISTNANILYVSGTKDIASFYAGQVLIDSKRKGKNNIDVKLYEYREHSFFEVDYEGVINYEVDSWQEVFDDITKWFNKN